MLYGGFDEEIVKSLIGIPPAKYRYGPFFRQTIILEPIIVGKSVHILRTLSNLDGLEMDTPG
ncbi:Uncharacterised protein [uncultured archaeon]|nr:Uncharacterised protein [uncultured archaeon]